MASKRTLKKQIQDSVSDIVEEAYSYQLYNPGKKDKEVDALIDKSVDVLEDTLSKINSAKDLKKRSEVKKHFEKVKTDFEKAHQDLSKEVSKLG